MPDGNSHSLLHLDWSCWYTSLCGAVASCIRCIYMNVSPLVLKFFSQSLLSKLTITIVSHHTELRGFTQTCRLMHGWQVEATTSNTTKNRLSRSCSLSTFIKGLFTILVATLLMAAGQPVGKVSRGNYYAKLTCNFVVLLCLFHV